MVCCLHYCFLPKRMFTILSFVYRMMVILLYFVFRLDFFLVSLAIQVMNLFFSSLSELAYMFCHSSFSSLLG